MSEEVRRRVDEVLKALARLAVRAFLYVMGFGFGVY